MAVAEHGKTFRPKDDQEFLKLLQRIGDMERGIEAIESAIAEKTQEYVDFKNKKSLEINELEAILANMVSGFEAYAADNRKRLTEQAGKKTVNLKDHAFGWHNSPASVVADDELKAIQELEEKGYADCVQIIKKIDRSAVKECISDFSRFQHLGVATKEGFFIKPFGTLKKISKVGKIIRRLASKKS